MLHVILLPMVLSLFGCGVLAGDGSVDLDAYSFDKVISKFPTTLVKFDVAYPYGENHDAYIALAKSTSGVEDLLVAEVGVKNYGEKDNEELAKKYGASQENFPVVKLFLKGKAKPVDLDSKKFTTDDLRRFIRVHSGLYLSLPGCVQNLDKIALKFMSAEADQKAKMLKDVDQMLTKLKDKDAVSGKVYKLIMQRIIEKGDSFLATEEERVKKLLAGKLTDEKKKDLSTRLNILQTFNLKPEKDEL